MRITNRNFNETFSRNDLQCEIFVTHVAVMTNIIMSIFFGSSTLSGKMYGLLICAFIFQ